MAQKYQRKPKLKESYKKTSQSVVECFRRLSYLTALRGSNLPDEVKNKLEQLVIQDIEANKPDMHPLALLDANAGIIRITTKSERTDFSDLATKADIFTCANLVWAGIEWTEIQEKLPETLASWFDVMCMLSLCDLDRFWKGQGKRKHTQADCLSDWNSSEAEAWDNSPFNIDAKKLADMLRKSKGW